MKCDILECEHASKMRGNEAEPAKRDKLLCLCISPSQEHHHNMWKIPHCESDNGKTMQTSTILENEDSSSEHWTSTNHIYILTVKDFREEI